MKRGVLTGAWVLAFAASLHAQSLEKQREIAGKKAVTLGDAVLIFYALNFEPEKKLTLEQAFEKLAEEKIIPGDWEEELGETASLGQVCYLICSTLKVRGGLTERIFGRTKRSSYRECARAQIVRRAGPHSKVSGRDLIGIAGRVEELLRKSD